jgi:hypothetical protein
MKRFYTSVVVGALLEATLMYFSMPFTVMRVGSVRIDSSYTHYLYKIIEACIWVCAFYPTNYLWNTYFSQFPVRTVWEGDIIVFVPQAIFWSAIAFLLLPLFNRSRPIRSPVLQS